MPITTRAPSPALAPFVASLGYFEGSLVHDREVSLPTGTAQLLINLDQDTLHYEDGTGLHRTGGAALSGPSSRPALIDPTEQRAIAWVAFRVGGAYPFFTPPADTTRDRLVDLAELWGRDGATLRERLLSAPTPADKLRRLEALLVARAVRPLQRDQAVWRAARALHAGAQVGAVSDLLGWAGGRLTRHLLTQVGMAPKRFARVRRFQRLLTRVTGVAAKPDWACLAGECGYHDQAHLIHEFRAFAGLPPGDYRPRCPDEPNHVPLAAPTG